MLIKDKKNMKRLALNICFCVLLLVPVLMSGQVNTACMYSALERNFTAKRLFDQGQGLSLESIRHWDAYLDSNLCYALTFREFKDSLGVFNDGLKLFYFGGFKTRLLRLSPNETKKNYGIPYSIEVADPFEGYESYMNDGIIGLDTSTNSVYFIGGALFLDDLALRSFMLDGVRVSDYLKYRFHNYRPEAIVDQNGCYYFHSGRTGGDYRYCPSSDSLFAPLEKL